MSLLTRRRSLLATKSKSRSLSAAIRRPMLETLEGRVLLSGTASDTTISTLVSYHPVDTALPVGATPTGLTPAEMRAAYGVNLITFGGVAGDGAGQTIAIVDAYSEPTIVTDLAAFDAKFHLPDPPSFIQINEAGSTTPLPSSDVPGGWGGETALDVEWAHVIAPQANIVLVEATTDAPADLYASVVTAAAYPGVSVVSMSWGFDELDTDAALDSNFVTPTGHIGVTFVASSGDTGSYSSTTGLDTVEYPAASPNVLGVGGTTLTTGAMGAYVSEIGWGSGAASELNGGSGGGISQFASQPAYQNGIVTQSTTQRCVPDVSMDADPNTGVPVYDVYDNGVATPWQQVGGTSLAAPMWAGLMAIANQGLTLQGLPTLNSNAGDATLPAIYALPSSDFHDITVGDNGDYSCAPGYDCVTGRGTPVANKLIHDLCYNSGSISGTVYEDINGSGNATADTGLPGVTVYIDANNNGKLDGSEISAITDANGNFTFTGLAAGTYQIGEVVPGHYVLETTSTTETVGVTVGVGQAVTGENFFDAPVINGSAQAVYRLYSPITKEHLYTSDINEYNTLGQNGWYQEGVAYEDYTGPATVAGVSDEPFYRLYNTASQQHLWTTDLNEYNTLASRGWIQEGIVGYVFPSAVAGSTAMYRLNYPFGTDLHVWTTDDNEYTTLAAQYGWTQEGVIGYVWATSSGLVAPTGLTATVDSSNNIDLAWNNSNVDAIGFYVLRSTDNVNFNKIATLTSITTTAWTDATATPGVTYYYQVRAYNGFALSTVSNTASATVPASVVVSYSFRVSSGDATADIADQSSTSSILADQQEVD